MASVNLRNAVILCFIAALGIGLAVFLFIDTATTEYSLSEAAFRGSFTSVMSNFAVFMTGQLRAIRSVADSLATHGSMPSYEAFNRTAREFDSLFTGEFSGMGTAARVANNSTALSEWDAATKARLNLPHIAHAVNSPPADADDEFVWLIQDPSPLNDFSIPFVGFRLTSDPFIRHMFQQINETASSNPPSANEPEALAVTGIISFQLLPSLTGMMAFASVFDDDPMAYCVGAITTFDTILETVGNLSAHAVVQLEDHLGGSFPTTASGPCKMDEADQVITQQVPLISGVTWTISIGQCPGYNDAYVSWRRWVLLVITILMTLLSLSTAVFVMKFQHSLVQQALDKVRGEEKDKAHRIVVGYICHELRNPLHIVKNAFQALSEQLKRSMLAPRPHFPPNPGMMHLSSADSGTVALSGPPVWSAAASPPLVPRQVHFPREGRAASDAGSTPGEFRQLDSDVLSDDEMQSVLGDATAALAQMQSTVNEVLDFRAIESGMNNLSLRKEPYSLSDLITPIVTRCRAFMPVGVGLQVCIADPKGIAHVDKGRIAQIITNGLSNAGKFTSGGNVVVAVALVRRSQASAIRPTETVGPPRWLCGGRGRRRGSGVAPRPLRPQGSSSKIVLGDPDPDADDLYLSVTVSNPRSGPLIPNTEDCFIPFKDKGGGGVWKPVKAPPEHVSSMFGMWEYAMEKCRRLPCVTLPELRSHRSGAVKVTTGLGLPLSRGFAHASAGWLALDEGRGDGMTHLWCVVEAMKPPRIDTDRVIAQAPSIQVLIDGHAAPSVPASSARTLVVGGSLLGTPVAVDTEGKPTVPGRLSPVPDNTESNVDSTTAIPTPLHRSPAVSVPFSSLRFVFVDDEPPIQRVGMRLLRALGIPADHVTLLADGSEALSFLQGTHAVLTELSPAASSLALSAHPSSSADIMFLDIRMPGKSGIEVMQEIGRSPPFPIIAMTGNVDKDSVEEYRALGFAGCVGKPFDKSTLRHAIEQALTRQWFALVTGE